MRVKSFFILAILMAGCAPHFYESGVLVLEAEGLTPIEYFKIHSDCIRDVKAPSNYKLERTGYLVEFQTKAWQSGVKAQTKSGDPLTIELEGLELRENKSYVTGLDPRFNVYFASLVPINVKIKLFDKEKFIGEEIISISAKTCKAVTIDAM